MASSFVSHCGSGEKFRDQTYPLSARYLKGQGVDPENPKCVVVAVFFKDRMPSPGGQGIVIEAASFLYSLTCSTPRIYKNKTPLC
jgi:hypothetical protein